MCRGVCLRPKCGCPVLNLYSHFVQIWRDFATAFKDNITTTYKGDCKFMIIANLGRNHTPLRSLPKKLYITIKITFIMENYNFPLYLTEVTYEKQAL